MTMGEQDEKAKLHVFHRDLCIGFVGSLRSLSLYPPEHPETRKKLQDFFSKIDEHLSCRSNLAMLFIDGEVVVENTRLPELSSALGKFLKRLEQVHLQRLVFQKGMLFEELVQFLQILLSLLKNPAGAELVLAEAKERLPHIIVSSVQLDDVSQVSYEDFSGTLQEVRQSMLSLSDQIKGLFSDVAGGLPVTKVALARQMAETIHKMVMAEELPIKVLIYRRNPDPDPYQHAIHVSAVSMALAQRLKVHGPVLDELCFGALLHDIGLFLSPPLAAPASGAITLDEKKKRWEHPIRGAEILLSTRGIPDLAPLIAYEHHLHYDGGGYPEQKQRRQLNLASLIVSITNTYDDLRRTRPERAALPLTDALNWMDARQGKEFHPLLLKQFRAMVKAQALEKNKSA
jgi:HD-GYP domain-containing protein (c-di-GMP phosphodiesterase class II)